MKVFVLCLTVLLLPSGCVVSRHAAPMHTAASSFVPSEVLVAVVPEAQPGISMSSSSNIGRIASWTVTATLSAESIQADLRERFGVHVSAYESNNGCFVQVMTLFGPLLIANEATCAEAMVSAISALGPVRFDPYGRPIQ